MKDLDNSSYTRFCSKQNLHKSLNTLKGIIDGANIDGSIIKKELLEIKNWCEENAGYRRLNPFNELVPMLERALEDGVLDEEEIEDLRWFLNRSCGENPYYSSSTSELQYLQGLMHGILADGVVSKTEVEKLNDWMESNEYLAGSYPFDEIYSILTDMTRDHVVSSDEAEFLKAYFAEFVTLSTNNQIEVSRDLKKKVTILGVCAVTQKSHSRIACSPSPAFRLKAAANTLRNESNHEEVYSTTSLQMRSTTLSTVPEATHAGHTHATDEK